MEKSAFLPGLILALAVWILPLLVRFLPTPFVSPILKRFPRINDFAPWIYNLGGPYAGLLLGWISSRDFGLTGQSGLEWMLGAAASILIGLILAWVSVRFADPRGWNDGRDEARWCLYRAAAWPWLNFLSFAVVAALIASLIEFAVGRRKDQAEFSLTAVIPFLVRTTGSSVLFLLAHNFFLAMLYYLMAFIAARPEFQGYIENMRARINKFI